MQNLVIRRPRIKDINAYNEFFDVVLKDTFEKNGVIGLYDVYEKEIKKEKIEFLNEDLETDGKKRYILLATTNDKLVGTASYGPSNNDINKCTNNELKDLIEIGTVFVHPEYQKKGIGSLLLNHIYAELNKKGIKEFCLDSGYKNAQEVWTKKFGIPQYKFKNYWGKDANYMIWKVKLEDVFK